jgi:hypothetical protein
LSAYGKNSRQVVLEAFFVGGKVPLVTEPMTKAAPRAPTAQSLTAQPPRLSMLLRAVLGLCGSALVAGFFLPWVTAGTALQLSGLGLAVSGGEMVQAISGTGSLLLFLVPLLGLGLIAGAVSAHRWTPWMGTLGAGGLLLFGLFKVIALFISSTGTGMWLVIFAAFFTLVIGALSLGRS